MNEQIRWITNLLDTHGIPYWVDEGTLLGLMREGDILTKGRKKPDNDIDISMWSRDEPRFRTVLPLIRKAGYAIRTYRYCKLICTYFMVPSNLNSCRQSLPVIDVSIYRRHGDYAWTPGYYPTDPNGLPDTLTLSEREVRYRDHLARVLSGMAQGLGCTPIIQLPLALMRRWIAIEVCAWPWRLFYNVGTNWVPFSYFDRMDRQKEFDVLLPQNWESYLEFRYRDWKTPVEKWRYWIDDGGFHCQTPHEMINSVSASSAQEQRASIHGDL